MQKLDRLTGKTIRWRFEDGPTAGKDYEHSFARDGSVRYRMGGGDAEWTRVPKERASVEQVADGVFVVSYLHSPYALTTILNARDATVVAFASNETEWFRQAGTFDVVSTENDISRSSS